MSVWVIFVILVVGAYHVDLEVQSGILDNITSSLSDLTESTAQSSTDLSTIQTTLQLSVLPEIGRVDKVLQYVNTSINTQGSAISSVASTVSTLPLLMSYQKASLTNIASDVSTLQQSVSDGVGDIKSEIQSTSAELKQHCAALQAATVSELVEKIRDQIVSSVSGDFSALSTKIELLEAKLSEHQRVSVEKADQIIEIITKTVEIGQCQANLTLALMMTTKDNIHMKYMHQECKLPARCHGYTALYPSNILSNDWYWVQPLATSIPYKTWCEFGNVDNVLVGWQRMTVKPGAGQCTKDNNYKWSEEEILALDVKDIAVTEASTGVMDSDKPSWLLRDIAVEEMVHVSGDNVTVDQELDLSVTQGADVVLLTCIMLKCSGRGDEYIRFAEDFAKTHQIVLNLRCNNDQVEMYGENSKGWNIYSQTFSNVNLAEGAALTIKVTREANKLEVKINGAQHDFNYNGNWLEFSQYRFDQIQHVRLSQQNAHRYEVRVGKRFTPLQLPHVQLTNLFNCKLPSGQDWGSSDEFALTRITGSTDTLKRTWRDDNKVYIMCAKQNTVTAWEDLGTSMSWITGSREGEGYYVFNDCLTNLQEDARSVNSKLSWGNTRALWIM